MFNAPRYVRSDVIHNDYKIPIIVEEVKSNNFKYTVFVSWIYYLSSDFVGQ